MPRRTPIRFGDRLTTTEKVVFNLLRQSDDMTRRKVASTMNISVHGVNKHVKNIYLKLDLHSVKELRGMNPPPR